MNHVLALELWEDWRPGQGWGVYGTIMAVTPLCIITNHKPPFADVSDNIIITLPHKVSVNLCSLMITTWQEAWYIQQVSTNLLYGCLGNHFQFNVSFRNDRGKKHHNSKLCWCRKVSQIFTITANCEKVVSEDQNLCSRQDTSPFTEITGKQTSWQMNTPTVNVLGF